MRYMLFMLMCSVGFGQLPAPKPPCVPFHNVGNRIVVDVTVNGQGPYSFLLDTGSQRTMIDSAVATAYKLPDDGTTVVIGVGGARTIAFYTKATVGIDGQTSDVRAIVYNFAARNYTGIRVYGVIGVDFINQHSLTIDGLHTCLTVH